MSQPTVNKHLPVIVLYHGNCYDGFGAALAAHLHFARHCIDTTFIPVVYGNPPPPITSGCDLYILDFSYPAKTLLELAAQCHSITILDHHATAEADLKMETFADLLGVDARKWIQLADQQEGMNRVRNIRIRFDTKKSGAVLAWEYFHGNFRVPQMFLYLQDRDLWKFELPRSAAIASYMRTLPWSLDLWHYEMNQMEEAGGLAEAARIGAACSNLIQRFSEIMADTARLMLFDLSQSPPVITTELPEGELKEGQHLVPVANATVSFSETNHELLKRNPEAKFVAYYLDRKDGLRQWGLASRENYDCSPIAKAFGGGGHKQACGFTQKLPTQFAP